MKPRMLIVGATGILGAPVAAEFLRQGFRVRVLVRDEAKAAGNPLLEGAEFVAGDVLDRAAVGNAVKDCDGAYSSLRSDSFLLEESVEYRGNRILCEVAADMHLGWLGYISGAGDLAAHPQLRPLAIKSGCEALVAACGVPWTVFKPSHFFESLPMFVRNGRIAIPGRQRQAYHYLAAEDYARVVVAASSHLACHGRALTLLGPERLTMAEALTQYRDAVMPGTRIGYLPLWLPRLLGRLTRNRQPQHMAELFAAFAEGIPEGDASTLPAGFPPLSTTCAQWCAQQAVP